MAYYLSDEYTKAIHQARTADAVAVRSRKAHNHDDGSATSLFRGWVEALFRLRRPDPCPTPCPDAA